MIDTLVWLYSVIPWGWYLCLAIWILLLGPDMGYGPATVYGICMSTIFTIVYYMLAFMWMMSFGIFFETPWDMPWWLWTILALAGIGSVGPAVATTVIHHKSDERVSSVTITKK